MFIGRGPNDVTISLIYTTYVGWILEPFGLSEYAC